MTWCARCREAVSASLDGEEDPRDRLIIRNHLDRCAECRGFAASARALKDLTSSPSDEAGPVVACCGTGRPRLSPVGDAACGCSPDCSCGCQHGGACRCASLAA